MALTRKITIDTNHGPTLIDAYVHGKFAVNLQPSHSERVNPVEALWSVTHIATGRQITCIWGRAEARNMARRLDAAVADDMTLEDYKSKNEVYKAFGKIVASFVKRD